MIEAQEILGRKGGTGMTLTLDTVKEYIWSKYIENEDTDEDLDESEILRFLEEHYRKVQIETAEDSFYYAILMFERAWEEPDKKEEYFCLARRVLMMYREKTGERDWEAVEDRLADIDDFFGETGIDPESLSSKYRLPTPRVEVDVLKPLREQAPQGMAFVPPATVTVPGTGEKIDVEAFYIDLYPVTNSDFQKFLDATQYRTPKCWGEEGFKDPSQPVVGVSYFDAEKYAEWAGKTIPSHTQWISAARGASENPYPWGTEQAPERMNCLSGESSVLESIGSRSGNASQCGVQDMLGWVWEWTETWFDTEKEFRIIKGGSWVDPCAFVSVDSLLYAAPKEKIDNIGFRCCRKTLGVR